MSKIAPRRPHLFADDNSSVYDHATSIKHGADKARPSGTKTVSGKSTTGNITTDYTAQQEPTMTTEQLQKKNAGRKALKAGY